MIGAFAQIRPAATAANGEKVTKIREMTMAELAELSGQLLEEKPLSAEEIAEELGGKVAKE
ncbi:MAG: hypothetical protein J6V96_02350 [Aeriscardovia sp.]|nr:hypothetical protein [Aeriscardovia sp.]